MSITYPKVFAILTINLVAISVGFTFGQMTGMIRALQKKEDGIIFSESEITLIAACFVPSWVIGVILLALVGDRVGRRLSFMFFSIPMIANWIILYFATDFAAFMASRLLTGVSMESLGVLNIIGAAEFTSSKTRPLLLSIISLASPSVGTGLGHVLGIKYHWRTVAVVGLVLASVAGCLPYFWVESPHWLASKGKFGECEKVYRKLHGGKVEAENELRMLLMIETKKQKVANETNKSNGWRKLRSAFKRRYFWDLILMNTCLYVYYTAAGKMVFSSLATVMLEEITGSSDVLLYTLLIDVYILIGICISCILIKKMSIRGLLFASGLLAVGILIALSGCLYFKTNEIYFQWINVVLLAFYFIIIHVGPYPVMLILLGEIFPLEIKLYCFVTTSPVLIITFFSSILLLPSILSVMGYHGLFLMNSGIMLVCLAYLWVRLPETKGKTLQEIEVFFKTRKFDVDEVLSDEQLKNFI